MIPQNIQFNRQAHSKHWNPKWKRLRAKKYVKIDLPNFHEKFSELSPEEIKSKMREKGVLPPRPWMERPFFISCTGGVFEPYVPPEGDGKKSFVTVSGAKQKFEFLEKKSKSMLAVRKIRSYEEDFSPVTFAEYAQNIYVQSHEALAAKDKHRLRELISERAYPEMIYNVKDKTIHWQFLKSLEVPRVVHARCTDIVSKENIYGQVTIRFHTQQKLAIYDRFGRLMHGSEILAKDVLEYVVFEKHLSNEYGTWRLHDKIIPDWMPEKQPAPITYRIDDEPIKEIERGEQHSGENEAKPLEIEASSDGSGEKSKKLATA